MLFTLQFFYWIIGRKSSKNLKNSTEDYFFAGKNVRFFPLMMTFLATQVGGGIILGSAEEAYRYGWYVILFPMGSALGLILLGLGAGKKLAKFSVSTIAEIFEKFYGSRILRKFTSLLSIISLFMILVAQIIASGKFLISMGINNTPLFIIFWSVVIIYTVQGGLKAVISTDILQALVFSFIFFFCFAFVLCLFPDSSFTAMQQTQTISSIYPKLSSWFLMPLLFMIIEQDMGQRCFAGATPKAVSQASFWAGISTMAICIVPVFFGILAKKMNINITEGGSVLMSAIENTTNPLITLLVGCAVLAAIISTASSLINAISSNIAIDFKSALIQQKKPLKTARIITAAVSISAIFFTFFFDNIVDLMIQSYDLSVSCLFIPIFIALFKKRGFFISALLSIAFGIIGFFLFRIHPIFIPKEIASIILSLIGYGLGEVIELYRYKKIEV